MYCRSCQKELHEEAEFCVGCGMRPNKGRNYCQTCGVETKLEQELCIECGVRLAVQSEPMLDLVNTVGRLLKPYTNYVAASIHLLGIFTIFIGPLIVYLLLVHIFKMDDDALETHARTALNFQLTVLVAYFWGLALFRIGVGEILIPVALISSPVFGMIAAVAAFKKKRFSYPISLSLVKPHHPSGVSHNP